MRKIKFDAPVHMVDFAPKPFRAAKPSTKHRAITIVARTLAFLLGAASIYISMAIAMSL